MSKLTSAEMSDPMSEPLTLYTNPMSRGRIARWMLEEVGEPYDVNYLDYGAAMKSDAFLAINPLGKVPTLQHGDRVITEGAAICAYLADAFPAAGLAPPLNARADYYRWMFFSAGPLEAGLINAALGVVVPDEKLSMAGYGEVATMLDMLEAVCARQPFLAGDEFTAADVSAGSQIGWGMQFGTVEKRAAFEAYWARVSSRPAYVRANALDDAAMKPS